MHVPWVRAESPQRHGAQFVGGILRWILNDAVAGSNVVEQEIAVRMNNLVPQRLRHGERSPIDHRPRSSGNDGTDMAGGTADALKQILPRLGSRGCREGRVARRNLCAADEL